MSLREVLQRSEFSGLTDQQALDLLKTTVDFSVDSTSYTWSGLLEKLMELVGVFPDLTLDIVARAPSLVANITNGGTLDKCLSSGGWDFSKAANRYAISLWMPGSPPEAVILMNAMLFVGCPTGKKWKFHGLEQEPTLQEVTDTTETIATENERQKIVNAWNAVANALDSGVITTKSQANTLFSETE